MPESDITVHRGIRVTTPLRTVIDLAGEDESDHLRQVIDDCLRRRLFTVEEALLRTSDPDMVSRRGAIRVRELLLH